MKINLTNKQYDILLKLVGLGTMVVDTLDEVQVLPEFLTLKEYEEIDELDNYLLSFAKDFGCEDLVEEIDGFYNTSLEFENTVLPMMDAFVSNMFYEDLIRRLVLRDFATIYTEDQIEKMTEDEAHRNKEIIMKKYIDEFEKNDLKNLVVKGLE